MMNTRDKSGGLGRFGHHPDPAIDFCVEVEAIEGLVFDATHGMVPSSSVRDRISRAMDFRVGGDPGAVAAKGMLRDADALLTALAEDAE